jgi:hypothetical protein
MTRLYFLMDLLIAFLVTQCVGAATEQYHLTVQVVHLLNETPVTGATVTVVALKKGGSDSDGRVVARQSLSEGGSASFQLSPGYYLIRMQSGYTGRIKINLEENKEVIFKVIPVLQ